LSAERDTHFAGSARLVIKSLPEFPNLLGYTIREWREEATTILAQYAYDLVQHTIENTAHIDLDMLLSDEHVERIPDMTEVEQ
jgi:hypothetical protein